MLILLFRGIFLIGILSWYSTNVWKMIDGYFKDSFEKYLQREYQKNPKMREDVSAYGLSGENDKGRFSHDSIATGIAKSIPNANAEQRSCERFDALGEETCPIDSASMETAAGAQAGSGSLSPALSAPDMMDGGHASKSEVSEKGGHHKNAYLEGSSRSSAAKQHSRELPVKDDIINDDINFQTSINMEESNKNIIETKKSEIPQISGGLPVEDIVIVNNNPEKSMLKIQKSIDLDSSHGNTMKNSKISENAKISGGLPVKDFITDADDGDMEKSMSVARKSINIGNSHENSIETKKSGVAKTSGELPVEDVIIDDETAAKSILVARKSIDIGNSHENSIETKKFGITKTSGALPVEDVIIDDENTAKSMLVGRKSINNGNSHENTIESKKSKAATTKRTHRDVETPDVGAIASKKSTNRKSTQRRSSRERKNEILEDKDKMKKKKKLKVKTITLTDEDFKQAKLRAGLQDYDFSEFDDDDDEGAEPIPEGIRVSQLPFKPRADIGNLERVTHEEFCPLTLEDEANCGEIKNWP